MNEMAQRGKKATDAAVRAAQQTSTAMQYLQMQQQQLSVSASITPPSPPPDGFCLLSVVRVSSCAKEGKFVLYRRSSELHVVPIIEFLELSLLFVCFL